MKTKTSILAALVAMAGSASLMAQVYSLNVVGYVNTTLPSGFSIISNPLNASTNKLSTLIPSPPVNSQVYRFGSGGYTSSSYALDDNDVLNWSVDFDISPGEGFWFKNPTASSITNTFVGEVPQGTLVNPVPANFSLKSSIVPQSAAVTATMNYLPNIGDIIYFFRNGAYTRYDYALDDNDVPNWAPNDPVPNVGEGFWIFNSTGAKSWTRTFNP
jgi:hypothetical protein